MAISDVMSESAVSVKPKFVRKTAQSVKARETNPLVRERVRSAN